MDIVKIVAIGIITCVASIIVKQIKPELGIFITISGSCVIIITLISSFSSDFSILNKFSNVLNLDNKLIKTIIKIVGTGYLVEFGASICNDSGHTAIAEKIVFAGKIAILLMCLPIINNLVEILVEIMP